MLSSFSCVGFFATLWAVAHQALLGFSRREYWSGLPCPPPGDLPNPGIKSASLASPALAGGFFTTSTKSPVCRLFFQDSFKMTNSLFFILINYTSIQIFCLFLIQPQYSVFLGIYSLHFSYPIC